MLGPLQCSSALSVVFLLIANRCKERQEGWWRKGTWSFLFFFPLCFYCFFLSLPFGWFPEELLLQVFSVSRSSSNCLLWHQALLPRVPLAGTSSNSTGPFPGSQVLVIASNLKKIFFSNKFQKVLAVLEAKCSSIYLTILLLCWMFPGGFFWNKVYIMIIKWIYVHAKLFSESSASTYTPTCNVW